MCREVVCRPGVSRVGNLSKSNKHLTCCQTRCVAVGGERFLEKSSVSGVVMSAARVWIPEIAMQPIPAPLAICLHVFHHLTPLERARLLQALGQAPRAVDQQSSLAVRHGTAVAPVDDLQRVAGEQAGLFGLAAHVCPSYRLPGADLAQRDPRILGRINQLLARPPQPSRAAPLSMRGVVQNELRRMKRHHRFCRYFTGVLEPVANDIELPVEFDKCSQAVFSVLGLN